MVREISFSIGDIDRIYVYSDTFTGYYAGKRLFAGQAGENEATRLKFRFGEKFDGYSVRVNFGGAEATAYMISEGDREFSYDIPEESMIPEVVKMQVEAEKDGQSVKSRVIYLEVKRDA
jgi:hypothetical protein